MEGTPKLGHSFTRKRLLNVFDRACKRYHAFYSGKGISVYATRFFHYPVKFSLRFFATSRFLPQNITVRSRTFWGKTLFVLLADKNAGSLWYFGLLPKQELRLTRYLIKVITPQDVFYDVGANYGFYSALAGALGARVHAFEPHPLVAKCLQRSFPYGVIVNAVALSDKPGDAEFFDRYHTHQSGGSTLLKDVAGQNWANYRKVMVSATTLDVYKGIPPTIIKIDVEGAEVNVLKGGRGILKRYNPHLIIELWGGKNVEGYHRSLEVASFLRDMKYRVYQIDKNGDISRISHVVLKEQLAAISYDNFLFCP